MCDKIMLYYTKRDFYIYIQKNLFIIKRSNFDGKNSIENVFE